jgi:hypothetical protein
MTSVSTVPNFCNPSVKLLTAQTLWNMEEYEAHTALPVLRRTECVCIYTEAQRSSAVSNPRGVIIFRYTLHIHWENTREGTELSADVHHIQPVHSTSDVRTVFLNLRTWVQNKQLYYNHLYWKCNIKLLTSFIPGVWILWSRQLNTLNKLENK